MPLAQKAILPTGLGGRQIVIGVSALEMIIHDPLERRNSSSVRFFLPECGYCFAVKAVQLLYIIARRLSC